MQSGRRWQPCGSSFLRDFSDGVGRRRASTAPRVSSVREIYCTVRRPPDFRKKQMWEKQKARGRFFGRGLTCHKSRRSLLLLRLGSVQPLQIFEVGVVQGERAWRILRQRRSRSRSEPERRRCSLVSID